ncbi:MAG: IS66 family insertion sequence element accessory protein TnpB [Paracoccaceae bacterium]
MKVCTKSQPLNFRKAMYGLAVQEIFWLGPFGVGVFTFRSCRADWIKLLVWDQSGIVPVYRCP